MLRPSVYCHSGTEVRSEAASSSVDCPSGPSVRVSGHTPMKRVQSTCIDGVNALLLTEAKSIAGCSKYSIKIGVNVALETVRGRWESRDISIDELYRYADIDQVFSVMRSYFEGVAA